MVDLASRAPVLALALAFAACGETRGTLVTTADGGVPGTPWRPALGASWQVQLVGTVDTTVDASIYDVDLFETSAATIDALHAAGRRVICYVSVGTDENWRADSSSFPASAVGDQLSGFPNERWLDTRDATVRSLMMARLDVARTKRCDGVDLSNVAGGGAASGFPLTAADAVDYARVLAKAAHARGLGAGLGGAGSLASDVVGDYEWALAESCVAAGGCDAFAPFGRAGKVVFGVEFGTESDAATICPAARTAGLNALIKNRSFDAFRVPCP
jgi:hypothetical protein